MTTTITTATLDTPCETVVAPTCNQADEDAMKEAILWRLKKAADDAYHMDIKYKLMEQELAETKKQLAFATEQLARKHT